MKTYAWHRNVELLTRSANGRSIAARPLQRMSGAGRGWPRNPISVIDVTDTNAPKRPDPAVLLDMRDRIRSMPK